MEVETAAEFPHRMTWRACVVELVIINPSNKVNLRVPRTTDGGTGMSSWMVRVLEASSNSWRGPPCWAAMLKPTLINAKSIFLFRMESGAVW